MQERKSEVVSVPVEQSAVLAPTPDQVLSKSHLFCRAVRCPGAESRRGAFEISLVLAADKKEEEERSVVGGRREQRPAARLALAVCPLPSGPRMEAHTGLSLNPSEASKGIERTTAVGSRFGSLIKRSCS